MTIQQERNIPNTEPTLIGFTSVDSGRLLIGDPEYLNYVGDQVNDLLGIGLSRSLSFPSGHEGAGVLLTPGLGDGQYGVYVTFAEVPGWGRRIVKMEIDFI